jgi:hypothetical protein
MVVMALFNAAAISRGGISLVGLPSFKRIFLKRYFGIDVFSRGAGC